MKKIAGLFILLFCGQALFSQILTAADLEKQFSLFQSNRPQEKLFVHTDKTFYLAGETIWFKIYAFDENSNHLIPSNSIAYIEIISRKEKPALQTKILLKAGKGSGSMTIPGSLGSGNYLLRAYTSWMKNFPADFYYQQTVGIVNIQSGSAPNETPEKAAASIQFFPEGGNLVDGLNSVVAFKAVGQNGKGLSCTGVILNKERDTVSRFTSFHNGMGKFELVPKSGETYYAVVNLRDSTYVQNLPVVATQGYTMHLSESGHDKIMITVQGTDDLINSPIYLLTQTRQTVKDAQSTLLTHGRVDFQIERKLLGDGISTFTLFDQSRQPVCERLFFKQPSDKLLISLEPDKQIYEPRKPVTFDLSVTGTGRAPQPADMSMSVFLIDSLQSIPQESLPAYLWLGSELKGLIESPAYYFEQTDSSNQALDNLLLTQGWRRFTWNEVLHTGKPAFEFLPELEGPVINGKVINKTSGTPGQHIPFFLTVPGANFSFCSATSNENGFIRFTFKPAYRSSAIVLQPALQADSNYRIEITSAYSDKFTGADPGPLLLTDRFEKSLTSRSIGNQVENSYLASRKRQYIPNPEKDSTAFFGMPDRRYNLDEYVRYVTMEEVMREFVEDVRVRKDVDKYKFRVVNALFNTLFEGDPLMLIDGVPVADANKIIALDPLKIKQIEVVSRKFFTGSAIAEGIVSVKSYSGDLSSIQLDPNAIVVEYEGLQQQRQFYSPVYNSEDQQKSSIPDYRNVLLWSPNIRTDATGRTKISFFTSDVRGRFAAVIQGISKEGLTGAALATFEVTEPNQ